MDKKQYLIIGFGLLIYIIILKYMFSLLFPFILAILCFFVLKPLIDRIQQYIPLQKSAIGISLLLFIYLALAFLLGILITALFCLCVHFFQQLPVYYDSIFLPFIYKITKLLESIFSFVPQDFVIIFQNWINQNMLDFISFASSFIKSIPSFLLSFFIFVISTFFLVLDYEDMKDCFLRLLQKKTCFQLVQFKNRVLKSLWIYMKCQIILMFVTFLILLIAFLILKIDSPLPYAFTICLLDSLPFIGIGIILIPMMVLYLFQGAYMKAVYLFCLYLIINMIRSFLEPHIMNKEMKIPAFLLLVSMVLHIHFFGIAGVILSPIHMSFIYQYFHKSEDLI